MKPLKLLMLLLSSLTVLNLSQPSYAMDNEKDKNSSIKVKKNTPEEQYTQGASLLTQPSTKMEGEKLIDSAIADSYQEFQQHSLIEELRRNRSNRQRTENLSLAINILDFLDQWSSKAAALPRLLEWSETYNLLIDISDILNLQDEDFKSHGDLHLQEGIYFSFYFFDRFSNIVHQRQGLFGNTTDGFKKIMGKILSSELPQLHAILQIIDDLQKHRRDNNVPLNSPFFQNPANKPSNLNETLDNLSKATKGKNKSDKTKFDQEYRSKVPVFSPTNLAFLTRVMGDYLTITELQKEIETLLLISNFKKQESREAMLAQMIKIGELGANKNLSNIIRKNLETIPWSDLEAIRDCLEHQDENGWTTIFQEALTKDQIDFEAWKSEFEEFKKKLVSFKVSFWDNPSLNFENWFNTFISGNNNYDPPNQIPPATTALSAELGKQFRRSNLYQKDSSKWLQVKNGPSHIDLSLLRELQKAIDSLGSSQQTEKTLYIDVLSHLCNILSSKNTYITQHEQGLFLSLLQNNLQEDVIASVALGVLNNDKTALKSKETTPFVFKLKEKSIDISPYLPILYKIKPLLPTTREVWGTLKTNPRKQPSLSDRKLLLEKFFGKLETSIHNLAHDGDCDMNIVSITMFHTQVCLARELAKTDKTAQAFVKEAEGIITSSTTTEEEAKRVEQLSMKYMRLLPKIMLSISKIDKNKFEKEVKQSQITSYRRYHQAVVPISFKDKKEEHLASVYNLSVGLSILKEVMNSYPGNLPAYLKENYSKLRRERNYLAHGDEMRDVAGITSLYIHFELLPLVHEITEEVSKL